MGVYIHPDRLTAADRQRVVRWLEANGCRDWVDLEPIIVRGGLIHYVSLGRKSPNMRRVVVRGQSVVTRARRLRLRVPLSAVH